MYKSFDNDIIQVIWQWHNCYHKNETQTRFQSALRAGNRLRLRILSYPPPWLPWPKRRVLSKFMLMRLLCIVMKSMLDMCIVRTSHKLKPPNQFYTFRNGKQSSRYYILKVYTLCTLFFVPFIQIERERNVLGDYIDPWWTMLLFLHGFIIRSLYSIEVLIDIIRNCIPDEFHRWNMLKS